MDTLQFITFTLEINNFIVVVLYNNAKIILFNQLLLNTEVILLRKIYTFSPYNNPPHIIIAVVHIFISLYFPVPRIVATAINIWENNDIFYFNVLE